ncbi:MAG: aspartate-semialdehyde dehydrogenase [Candidatus Dadabacteria bacterium]|nr:aspartate-semialdehyde dehydrogenase [Candidatus Dadabacteria bacterium]NIS09229.1 aspartate-semialdehyde dehydrogenase [Candidatus Dadabacteria bacterium]NIV42513.1 aspartate-semialdehyde dehydrogenase [Candidatus Dadabacteria bacterium]NIY22505.1 aspartate-semialdehyde dehydrogenase [Candidatus Dadabacteria bacterium]
MSSKQYNVAIAGATGAVGVEMISILEERNFPVKKLTLLASKRSVGKCLPYKGQQIKVAELTTDSFKDIDIALFSAGGDRSREFAPAAAELGAVVIDNSSAYRMDPQVPLIIPEINPGAISDYNKKNIIANPNCTTVVTIMGLKPIHDISRITRVVATSFQAVSGAGAQAIEELKDQTRAIVNSKEAKAEVFSHQIAYNVIPHIDSFTENGYTKEEMKLHNETRKILGDEGIKLTATTVRVPVFRSHCVSVNLETESKVSIEQAKEAFTRFPGLSVLDNPEKSEYPMPIDTSGADDCFIGRIREDFTVQNGISFWISGDQLRKGAALNAVQIAELLIGNYV